MKVIRAAGYIRVSTAEQAQRGLSLETQEAEIRLYARAHNMVLTEIYVDKGITARKQLNRREAFTKMMEAVDGNRIDMILVMRLDRWFRNVYDYHHMMNEHLMPHNVDWCAIKEDYDTTTTNGRLMINLRLAIAEQECDTDSDRIRDVQANMLRNRMWPYGTPPLGYKLEDKRLAKDSATQPHVEHYFQHLLQHGSMRLALKSVNETFGTRYEYKRAQTLAKRDLYYGEHNGIPGFCPPYLTQEEHQQIEYLVSKNIRARRTGPTEIHLFTGLLFCDDCGRRMNSQLIRRPQGKYHTYRCAHASDNNLCPNNKSISERTVEKYLLHYLDTELQRFLIDVQLQEKAVPLPIDNRPQIKAKQERVKELFINGVIELEEYRSRVEELEKQIIAPPEVPRRPLKLEKLRELLETNAMSLYTTMSREEKRSFWRSIICEIRVYRGTVAAPPIFL